ncbi:hypothetical protein [Fodinicola acaciae]|uniref:hypothetical protein n=1 Tax=Fodinicola acaciae TaxID=2681555 RepID=UPI0013D6B8AD|nr:hypothetical protein [Fodinicola acaciae]
MAASTPLAATGDTIAQNLQNFVAPIAGILIGLVGLKYLFGENRSLAGFIGFVFLGACVFALIRFGSVILGALGGILKGILS